MKRIISVLIALVMASTCTCMLTVEIFAAGANVALLDTDGNQVNTFDTIPAAVSAISKDGMTVKLLENCSIKATSTSNNIGSAYSYTLDGNGKTVECEYTGSANYFSAFGIWSIPATSVLTIKNITLNANGCHGVYQQGATVNYVNCTINTTKKSFLGSPVYVGGDVDTTAGSAVANIYSGAYWAQGGAVAVNVYKNATVNVYGGYFCSDDHAAALCYGAATAQSYMNVFDGKFESKTGRALIVNAYGNVNVFNGDFITGGTNSAMRNNNANAKLYAYEWQYNNVTNVNSVEIPVPKLNTGAAVRLVEGSNGIRFVSTIGADVIEKLNWCKATDISFGTVIAKASDVETVGNFNMGALAACGFTYVDIPAVDGLTGSDTDGYTMRAALVDIKEQNETLVLAAVPYVKATVNGTEVYYYGDYTPADHSRSTREVAKSALSDVKDSSELGYTKLVKQETYADGIYVGKYSPYIKSERDALYAYTVDN